MFDFSDTCPEGRAGRKERGQPEPESSIMFYTRRKVRGLPERIATRGTRTLELFGVRRSCNVQPLLLKIGSESDPPSRAASRSEPQGERSERSLPEPAGRSEASTAAKRPSWTRAHSLNNSRALVKHFLRSLLCLH